ncbi:MAG: hypothetical protein OEN02_18905, partial [Gammaproteobacteria bacterium]|nr:hypothetical protein [Gammaproteobacteria bacterium]
MCNRAKREYYRSGLKVGYFAAQISVTAAYFVTIGPIIWWQALHGIGDSTIEKAHIVMAAARVGFAGKSI